MEERAARVTSFIYDAPGDLLIYLFYNFLLFHFILPVSKYPNICVFKSAEGLFLGETSGIAKLSKEMIESLAPTLELMAVEGLGSSIPILEVVMETPF